MELGWGAGSGAGGPSCTVPSDGSSQRQPSIPLTPECSGESATVPCGRRIAGEGLGFSILEILSCCYRMLCKQNQEMGEGRFDMGSSKGKRKENKMRNKNSHVFQNLNHV